jgi:hypothetical protein
MTCPKYFGWSIQPFSSRKLGSNMQNMNRTQCSPIGAVEKIIIGESRGREKH